LGLLLLIAFLVWLPSEVKAPSNLPFQELEGRLILIQGNSLVSGQFGALQNDLESLIWEAADKYGIDYDIMYFLAKCESGLKHDNRYGDHNLAYGLYQWHQSSWNLYNKKFGTNLDRKNIYDQAMMTARVLSIGGQKNWTNCFRKQILTDLF